MEHGGPYIAGKVVEAMLWRVFVFLGNEFFMKEVPRKINMAQPSLSRGLEKGIRA